MYLTEQAIRGLKNIDQAILNDAFKSDHAFREYYEDKTVSVLSNDKSKTAPIGTIEQLVNYVNMLDDKVQRLENLLNSPDHSATRHGEYLSHLAQIELQRVQLSKASYLSMPYTSHPIGDPELDLTQIINDTNY